MGITIMGDKFYALELAIGEIATGQHETRL
jgi:hypothetical protein